MNKEGDKLVKPFYREKKSSANYNKAEQKNEEILAYLYSGSNLGRAYFREKKENRGDCHRKRTRV